MRLLAAALLLALPTAAQAKDLRNRIGVGFNNQFSDVSSISVRYGLPAREAAINVQLELVGGFSVLPGADDVMFLGARGFYGVVAEDNMNVYVGGGAGFLSRGEAQGVRIQPAAGAEFFFYGLENLGFSAEMGLNLDILGEDVSFFSASGGPAVGLHYYF